jgi:hypothetical protein
MQSVHQASSSLSLSLSLSLEINSRDFFGGEKEVAVRTYDVLFIKTNFMRYIAYVKSHTSFDSDALKRPLMTSSGISSLSVVSSQHIRMVISYKRLRND